MTALPKTCEHGTLVRAKTGGWHCISQTGCEFAIPEPAPQTSNERSLIDRLFDAQVASCSCLTKTLDYRYHDPMCRSRLFFEASQALSRQPSVTMNGFQARMVLKFIDGDDGCSLEVAELPARTASNGEHMAAGLYVWLSDYPEEGCLLLTEEPTVEGFCAEPKQVETSDDVAALRDALELMYESWENGDPCYEDPESCTGYIGRAFSLTMEDEQRILALIPKFPTKRRTFSSFYCPDCACPHCGETRSRIPRLESAVKSNEQPSAPASPPLSKSASSTDEAGVDLTISRPPQ